MATLIVTVGLVTAEKPDFQQTETPAGNTVNIPSTAIQITPNLYSLGYSFHDGKLVQGYAFVDYGKNYAGPPGSCDPWPECKKNGGKDTSKCYEFLAKGAKWRTIEPWIMNPSNTEGLNETTVFDIQSDALKKWEDAADGAVDGNNIQIFGSGTQTSETLVADTDSPDNQNEVYFGDVGQDGAIAVTIVWGIFKGPPQQRELVEWDQIYDQVDFDWSVFGDSGRMDFDNIATHEDGHSGGLDDLYEDKCSEETMYGYASNGETKKRSLELGDITGISELYK